MLQNKKALYDLLFRASAETLIEIAADPKHLGAVTRRDSFPLQLIEPSD